MTWQWVILILGAFFILALTVLCGQVIEWQKMKTMAHGPLPKIQPSQEETMHG